MFSQEVNFLLLIIIYLQFLAFRKSRASSISVFTKFKTNFNVSIDLVYSYKSSIYSVCVTFDIGLDNTYPSVDLISHDTTFIVSTGRAGQYESSCRIPFVRLIISLKPSLTGMEI